MNFDDIVVNLIEEIEMGIEEGALGRADILSIHLCIKRGEDPEQTRGWSFLTEWLDDPLVGEKREALQVALGMVDLSY
jgi:hypothetical protein